MVQLEKLASQNVLRLDVIISRQVEAVIVIYINHILEAVHHHIAILHIVVSHQVVLLSEVQAAQVINQRQQLIHHTAAILRRAVHQRRIVMIPMMTDTMIYMDGDYDYGRYDRDSDYADGVDDAMDEFGEDW